MKSNDLNDHVITGDPLGLWERHLSGWQEYKLWDLAEYINGKAFKPTDFSLEGLPVIKITELKYGLSPSTNLYSGEYEEKYLLKTGDLLFAWSDNPETSLDAFRWKGEKALLNQHIFRVVPRHNIDKTYLFFLLKYLRPTFIRTARDKATSMGHVKVSDLQRLIAYIPPLPEQKAIASILGALDDKIELNRKMNETLEAMARAIFKSWFVDFAPIPGLGPHKEWQDSPLGKIPKWWRVEALSELCEKPQYGFTASAKEYPIGKKFLPITDINKQAWIDWTSVPYCEISPEQFEQYRVKTGDILIARMADPGHSVLIEEDADAVFASYLIRFRPIKLEYSRYLQYWLQSPEYWDLVNARSAGTTRASLNAQVLGAFQLVVPSEDVAITFQNAIDTIRSKVNSNVKESSTLASIRDALLPKLLSGEIRVKDAERFVEVAE